jgi:phospholipase/lecithinase/hemolysin
VESYMGRLSAVGWLCFLLPMSAVAQSPVTFSRTVIFGDSFADTGNAYNTLGVQYDPVSGNEIDPFLSLNYTSGRFTDGPNTAPSAVLYEGLWEEQLNLVLPGVPLATPHVTTYGNNYAWVGATTQGGTSQVSFGPNTIRVKNMGQQVLDYLNSGAVPDAKTLYIVMGGATDLEADSSSANVTATAQRVTALVQELVDAGAVHVMVPNLPALSSNAKAPIAVATAAYRVALASDLAALQTQYAAKGVAFQLTQLDLYQLYSDVEANSAAFGFTNVGTAAQSLQLGADPDTYWSWDGVNPTTGGHHAIAAAACTALTMSKTTLTVDSATATTSTPSTLMATVSTSGTYGVAPGVMPTGTVAFYSDSQVLTTLTHTLLGTATLVNGVAKLTVSTLPPGAYTISAVYQGDANFPTGCTTPELGLTITVTNPGFVTVITNPNLYTGLAESASTTVYAKAVGAYTGNVTFTCGALPQYTQCHWTNATVPVAAAGGPTYYANLLITTGVTTAAEARPQGPLPPSTWRSVTPVVLAAVLLLPMGFAGRKRRLPVLLLLCVAMGSMAGMTGCMGSAGGATKPPTPPPTPVTVYTPPGSYEIPIIATSNGMSTTTNINFYIADGF